MAGQLRPDDVRLTEWAGPGGASAHWPPRRVEDLVAGLGGAPGGDLLVGLVPSDDAAVARLTPDLALVSSVDAFPPMVDGPADFGAIVAAHACGNVLAMGAEVRMAVALLALPEELPQEVAAAIVAAAAEVVAEAGGVLAGGHTVRSGEPLFGCAVQGTVHPDAIRTKAGARPGDLLVISKRIGTGLVLAGGSDDECRRVVTAMRVPSVAAARVVAGWGDRLHALTDVGTAGLAGAAWELARRSGAAVHLDLSAVPYYRGALAVAAAGGRAVGEDTNRAYVEAHLTSSAPADREAAAFDPQTSGGLLAAVDPALAGTAVDAGFVVVGSVGDELPAVVLR